MKKRFFINVFDVTGSLSGGIESNNSCDDRGSGSSSISGGNYGGISAANAIGVEFGHGFYNETFQVWNWQTAVWRDNPKVIMERGILIYLILSQKSIIVGELTRYYKVLFPVYYII